LISKKLKKMK